MNIAIAVATLVALGLRAYQLATPGYLLGVTEYDDGVYFGAAMHLTSGLMPYRDFIFVQPPGIVILMVPAALLAKVMGTAGGMAIGRVLTTLASAAGVVLVGLLVRHRGLATTVLACGLLAIYPDSVTTARTVLLEPWLALFCLLGAVAIFDAGRVTHSRRRLVLGGLALGFGGAIEVWAIVPALVIFVLLLPGPRRAISYVAGTAAGFLVPVLPFAASAPASFFRDLAVPFVAVGADAGLGSHLDAQAAGTRVKIWYRLKEMFGLSNVPVGHAQLVAVAAVILAFAVGALICGWVISRQRPAPLDWFALATAALVFACFLYPVAFYYHFVAFLAPFMAMAVALPLSRLVEAPGPRAASARPPRTALRGAVALLAALVVSRFAYSEISAVYQHEHSKATISLAADRAAVVSALQRMTPPGACVLTDRASFTIAADRFVSRVPGCLPVDDGVGANLALSHGRSAEAGAGHVPAVAAMWRDAFGHAQYVLLTDHNYTRIAWSPALVTYFHDNFHRVTKFPPHGALYVRNGLPVR